VAESVEEWSMDQTCNAALLPAHDYLLCAPWLYLEGILFSWNSVTSAEEKNRKQVFDLGSKLSKVILIWQFLSYFMRIYQNLEVREV
jgi:hypothetical protein